MLAVSSSVFLVIASITGIILAFEPIANASRPYAVADLGSVSVAETLSALEDRYDEILELKVNADDFVQASVITKKGENLDIYLNPITAEQIGVPTEKKAIFKFATNLHRSLFLKSPGRFFVGLVSLLLVFIAITGVLLIFKRQGGARRFFSRVNNDYSQQYYHVIFGRWFLIPILIISLTGVYLSLEKFSLLPTHDISHQIDPGSLVSKKRLSAKDFDLFQEIKLGEVRSILFPFSDEEDDYFQLELKDKEILVNQYTGEVVSEVSYPMVMIASKLSLILHTGRGSIVWSIVLLLASVALLFFMYSGFAMAIRRRKQSSGRLKNLEDKDRCEFVVLVGSETGNTFSMAKLLCEALRAIGKKVFLSELNAYTKYDKAKHLVILTSTYGDGDPPSNAQQFIKKFRSLKPCEPMSVAVVGFGSLAYPHYCQFAIDIEKELKLHPKFNSILPLYRINNQSFEAFKDWTIQWSNALGLDLRLKELPRTNADQGEQLFTVVERSALNKDNTFLLQLEAEKKVQFDSGDLLAVNPGGNEAYRFYSIAKIDGDILLSIKAHDRGICSNILSKLEKQDQIKGYIKRNSDFNFPKNAKEVVMISNGTGIAPFLGMVNGSQRNTKTHLFWGGRNGTSFEIYQDYVKRGRLTRQLSSLHIAHSQAEAIKVYVQDLVLKESDFIVNSLKNGGVIMICGSVAMQKEVIKVLEAEVSRKLNISLSTFQNLDKIKMDCY